MHSLNQRDNDDAVGPSANWQAQVQATAMAVPGAQFVYALDRRTTQAAHYQLANMNRVSHVPAAALAPHLATSGVSSASASVSRADATSSGQTLQRVGSLGEQQLHHQALLPGLPPLAQQPSFTGRGSKRALNSTPSSRKRSKPDVVPSLSGPPSQASDLPVGGVSQKGVASSKTEPKALVQLNSERIARNEAGVQMLESLLPSVGPHAALHAESFKDSLQQLKLSLVSESEAEQNWALNLLQLSAFHDGGQEMLLGDLPGLLEALLEVLDQGLKPGKVPQEYLEIIVERGKGALPGELPLEAPAPPWWVEEDVGITSPGSASLVAATAAAAVANVLRNLALAPSARNSPLLAGLAVTAAAAATLSATAVNPSPALCETSLSLLEMATGLGTQLQLQPAPGPVGTGPGARAGASARPGSTAARAAAGEAAEQEAEAAEGSRKGGEAASGPGVVQGQGQGEALGSQEGGKYGAALLQLLCSSTVPLRLRCAAAGVLAGLMDWPPDAQLLSELASRPLPSADGQATGQARPGQPDERLGGSPAGQGGAAAGSPAGASGASGAKAGGEDAGGALLLDVVEDLCSCDQEAARDAVEGELRGEMGGAELQLGYTPLSCSHTRLLVLWRQAQAVSSGVQLLQSLLAPGRPPCWLEWLPRRTRLVRLATELALSKRPAYVAQGGTSSSSSSSSTEDAWTSHPLLLSLHAALEHCSSQAVACLLHLAGSAAGRAALRPHEASLALEAMSGAPHADALASVLARLSGA